MNQMVRVAGHLPVAFVLLSGSLFPVAGQEPAPSSRVAGESIFAVITHRGGLAGGLAHNHFIVADRFIANVTFDPVDPLATAFHFSTLSEELLVDDPDLQARWIERVRELDLVDEFGDLSQGDRRKVRNEMLDDDQLDPEAHPVIAATIVSVDESPSQVGSVSFGYAATVDVTIHGVTVRRAVPARLETSGPSTRIEAVGRFEFEEFGIEPYSAFLGTVKVLNGFEIYVNFEIAEG